MPALSNVERTTIVVIPVVWSHDYPDDIQVITARREGLFEILEGPEPGPHRPGTRGPLSTLSVGADLVLVRWSLESIYGTGEHVPTLHPDAPDEDSRIYLAR
jgi:hypothetical protein